VRTRGCLIGIGGIVTSLVLCCALGYFVALPRFHQQIENELGRILSTEVAQRIDAQVPGSVNVPPGEYRISLEDLQRGVSSGSDNLQVEGLVLRAEGQDIVLGFAVSEASTSFRLTPAVSSEGYLQITNLRGDGGIVERILAPESIGNAVETSVNNYLQANGLFLQDVFLSGNDLVLQLGER
jgi:hypothetical protein